ncbi:MAG: endolytic transglycosylase MltG [Caldilineaceae bacterium]|nr:endolytic transglycosylase MltG [Caldilineaceae bacterium]
MTSKMTVHDRRDLVRARYNSRNGRSDESNHSWRQWISAEYLLTNLIRLAFLVLVGAVILGTWVVADAHLTEQFLGAPQATSGLIDPTAGQNALTPEYVEAQILAFNLRLRESELSIPAGDDPTQRPFAIVPGEPARFIASRLASAGFVRDADLFNLYLRVTGLERNIEAGNFILAETMTVPEIAEALQNALFEEIPVTIPEGFRVEEIAERLSENNVMESDRFLAAVRAPRTLSIFGDYDFLSDLPADGSLEGYLFPDTYRFPVFASTPELVLAPFLNNFEEKIGEGGLRGGSSGMTGRNLVTLASIVEREAVQADERPLIASVYLNRLNGACMADVGGTYLQADPTVQYAKGTVGNWWWKPERIEEYASVTSPYNTYLYQGLPPGPIASPGLSAIQSTQNPTPTDYCFFVATGDDGRHVFARTLAEHQQNMQIYGYQ